MGTDNLAHEEWHSGVHPKALEYNGTEVRRASKVLLGDITSSSSSYFAVQLALDLWLGDEMS
jgi:hypothetical protein